MTLSTEIDKTIALLKQDNERIVAMLEKILAEVSNVDSETHKERRQC